MVLGLSLAAFTQMHVALSLLGIVCGLIVVFAMLNRNLPPALTTLFFVSTALTDITGFMFPQPFDAADAVGIIDLAALAVAGLALYGQQLARFWRAVYVIGTVLALYFNCFVLVVQTFQKVAFFHQFAPTGKEPAFAAAQGVLLVLFIGLAIGVLRRFRPPTHISVMA